eukprot:9294964-Pyramimonas_sp.AAC.1
MARTRRCRRALRHPRQCAYKANHPPFHVLRSTHHSRHDATQRMLRAKSVGDTPARMPRTLHVRELLPERNKAGAPTQLRA